MKDLWMQLAQQARRPSEKKATDTMLVPPGFTDAVLRRVAREGAPSAMEAWGSLLRPALGFALATAFLCVMLQVKGQNKNPENLLVDTENLIRLAVLE